MHRVCGLWGHVKWTCSEKQKKMQNPLHLMTVGEKQYGYITPAFSGSPSKGRIDMAT